MRPMKSAIFSTTSRWSAVPTSGGQALPTQKGTTPFTPLSERIAANAPSSAMALTQPLLTGSAGLPPWM